MYWILNLFMAKAIYIQDDVFAELQYKGRYIFLTGNKMLAKCVRKRNYRAKFRKVHGAYFSQ